MARSGCIYGGTGRRKTSQVKSFAHYIAETTGKSTLLLSTDGGGWEPCQPEVSAGMVIPYRVETTTLPLVILRKISQGYWPVDTNETEPEKINLVPIEWDKVGGIAVEGWTSISQVVMRYLPDKGINIAGEDRSKLGSFRLPIHVNGGIESEMFTTNSRADYNFVMNMLYGLVMNFGALPCSYVLHTALESKTEDDDRSTICGPSIAGKKATAQCGSWVGDLIHAQDYTTVKTIKAPSPAGGDTIDTQVVDMSVRFYFRAHLDPTTGIPFPAKPRVTPEKISELDKRFPGGYFEPQPDGRNGFGEYLKELDRLSAEQGDSLKGWREKMDSKLRPKAASTQNSTK